MGEGGAPPPSWAIQCPNSSLLFSPPLERKLVSLLTSFYPQPPSLSVLVRVGHALSDADRTAFHFPALSLLPERCCAARVSSAAPTCVRYAGTRRTRVEHAGSSTAGATAFGPPYWGHLIGATVLEQPSWSNRLGATVGATFLAPPTGPRALAPSPPLAAARRR